MTSTTAAPSRRTTVRAGTDHTRLPLRDVLARVEAGIAHHATSIALPAVVRIDGDHGIALRSLLLDAAAHHFDTVRVHTGPHGPVIAVSRRRHRTHRHTT